VANGGNFGRVDTRCVMRLKVTLLLALAAVSGFARGLGPDAMYLKHPRVQRVAKISKTIHRPRKPKVFR
jgi:hypothetical protein